MTAVTAAWNRLLAFVGRYSMYRLVLIALAYVSKYWSIDPAVTQRRVIAMAINSAFAIYLGARFRDAETGRATVVYRRHAFDYGLITLSDEG